jgi:hypothetical protein
MALITSQEIKTNTSMGGNVDPDKFMHLLYDVQVLILEPSLGTALYDKIVTDFEADNLSGDYLQLFNSYIKPVLWHSVYAQYLRDGIILAQNTGIYENSPENASQADIENVKYVSKSAQSKADVYLERMERYLCDKSIPEYSNSQDNDYDLEPKEINTISGWYLPNGGEYTYAKYLKNND